MRELQNYTAFIDSVDKAVSLFGKSLVTMGDLKIQNKTDDVLKQLENMLPVRFGNNDTDPKVYGIVIDTSRSMQNASHLIMAKQSAIHLLGLLSDEDYVTVVSFSGDITVIQSPAKAKNRNEIINKINAIQPTQGTYIGKAMEETYKLMSSLTYGQKQVMLISDGESYTLENDDPIAVARKLKNSGIVTSVINTNNTQGELTLQRIAEQGGGSYYYIKDEGSLEELIFSSVADDMTESVIERPSPVIIGRTGDETVKGITYLPDVSGYVYSRAKSGAVTVLHSEYLKVSSGDITNPPLYAYWNYGNGKVSTLTTTLAGKWNSSWQAGAGESFLKNVASFSVPEERVDYPYTLSIEYDGKYSTVEMVPVILNPYATAQIKITSPDLKTVTGQLTFDSARYYYSFETPMTGKYSLTIDYSYDGKSFVSESAFNISYSPEYDSFAVFDPSDLHTAVRNRGTVSENGVPRIENDENEISTYKVSYTVPFLIAAIVLYVADIIIRKLKWNDIRGLFVSNVKRKGR